MLSFAAFFAMVYRAARQFDRTQKQYGSYAFVAAVLGIMLSWQTEAYSGLIRFFIIALFLMENADALEAKIPYKVKGRKYRLKHSHAKIRAVQTRAQ